jgi:hypothetical protein
MQIARSVKEMVADSEREIFEYGADGGGDDLMTDDDVDDLQLAQTDGWDGAPLDDAEQMASAALGDPNNFDRPIALHNEQEATQELIRLDRAILAESQRIQNEKRAVEYQAQAEERGLNLLGEHDGLTNAITRMDQQEQQINQLHEARLNDHLIVTAERYGDRFHTAYQYLTSLPVTQTSKALVRDIIESANPGEAMIDFYESGGAHHSSGGNVMPPSLNSLQPAMGRSSGGRRGGNDAGRYDAWSSDVDRPYSADRAENDAVFNDVWRD